MIDVRLWGISYKERFRALDAAEHFGGQYPDRIGARNGVIYAEPGRSTLYAYRTKGGQIVVRGYAQAEGE